MNSKFKRIVSYCVCGALAIVILLAVFSASVSKSDVKGVANDVSEDDSTSDDDSVLWSEADDTAQNDDQNDSGKNNTTPSVNDGESKNDTKSSVISNEKEEPQEETIVQEEITDNAEEKNDDSEEVPSVLEGNEDEKTENNEVVEDESSDREQSGDSKEEDDKKDNSSEKSDSKTELEKDTKQETESEHDLEDEEREKRLATTNPLIYADSVKTTSDSGNISINLKIKNNPGVLGMTVSIYYDENSLSLKNVKNGDAVDNILTLTAGNVLKSGCNFVWDGQELTKNDIKDGSLLEMDFSLVPGASKGKHPIKVICEPDDAVDGNLEPIKFEIVDGQITIK